MMKVTEFIGAEVSPLAKSSLQDTGRFGCFSGFALAEGGFAGDCAGFSTFDPGSVRDRSGFGSLLIRL
jgi:hypothetical protein